MSKFGHGTRSARTAAYPSIVAVLVGCRLRKEWAKTDIPHRSKCARLGITSWGDNALLYVTGGLIYGGQKVSASLDTPAGIFAISGDPSITRVGGTAGGGLEYRFTPALSGKIEGLWYEMGSENLFLTPTETSHFRLQGAIVRAGLNWHFGGPPFRSGAYYGAY